MRKTARQIHTEERGRQVHTKRRGVAETEETDSDRRKGGHRQGQMKTER